VEYSQAELVLLGQFTNAKTHDGGATGTTDFIIEGAFKKHPIMAGKERLTLPRYQPDTGNKRFLIFCNIYRGGIDAYRGIEVASGNALPDYFHGLLKIQGRPLHERLRYSFDHFGSPDPEVAQDAFREVEQHGYPDHRTLGKALQAGILVARLNDRKTPHNRYGLYALLLAECGSTKDAQTLRRLLDGPETREKGSAELFGGYVILHPQEGWRYLRRVLDDGKGESWQRRYFALRGVRFLWENRPDIVSWAKLLEATESALAHADLADFALEDLRKWKRWEFCDRVLALSEKESYGIPIVRRALLRFALSCPGDRAAAFVREQRRRDADLVDDQEELLRFETGTVIANPK
jgi:hypothetical protein